MASTLINLFNGGSQDVSRGGSPFIIARVTKVIYGPYLSDGKTIDPDYKDVTSIGAIKYVIINSAQYNTKTGDSNKPARPAFSSMQQYPVENEYVYIIPGPGLGFNEKAGDIDYYYLPPFNLWRACNHNAAPSLSEYADYINAPEIDYNTADSGLPNTPNESSIEYPLGNDFIEMGHIQNIKPFVGDLTLEGRWGQSMRFGSSLKTNTNPWSKSNADGDPIIIIRNGQSGNANSIGYNLTIEDINEDKSSIYLTAGQQIDILDIRLNFPLTSWNVSLGSNVANQDNIDAIVATMTIPPASDTTLSPDYQDKTTLS